MLAIENLHAEPAAAFVRSMLGERARGLGPADLIALGHAAGLKMHRFKRTMGLPRVRAVLGVLRGLAPASLLDIGTGRGVFLWPLMEAFPTLPVTAVEPLAARRTYLDAVRRGGVGRLQVVDADAAHLPFDDASFDVVTALEVLEHQADPGPLARESVRLAARSLVVSVPSKPDDNPEHVQLFTGASLGALLEAAGASSVRLDHVPGHIIAVARTARP